MPEFATEVRRRALTLIAGAAAFAAASGIAVTRAPAAASPPRDDAAPFRSWLAENADSLDAALAAFQRTLAPPFRADSVDARRVRTAFFTARRRYKRLEAVAEFYAPALAASLNSRRPEVDDDDAPPPSTLAAGGFPAIEPLLWPRLRAADAPRLRVLVAGMRPVVRRLRSLESAITPTGAQLIEISRLEIARISTVGITGFDAPITHASIRESADALDGLRELIHADGSVRWPSHRPSLDSVDASLRRATRQLRAHDDFESFDRLIFIAAYVEPSARAIDALRRATGVAPVQFQRGWRADVPSVYDAGAFDPRVYAAAGAPASTPALVALGERLFNEPALAGNGARACSSCHLPSHAFTDGLPRAARLDGHGVIARHTPTLINAALSPAQFADERAPTLEEQVVRVLENPAEMASSGDRAATAMSGRAEYQRLFRAAYGASAEGASGTVTSRRLTDALAAYVRSLVALDSRFDRAARGDTALLTAQERRGFTLFMGKAGCGTCHFAPLFNGTTPPLYRSADLEIIGTPVAPHQPQRIDPDSGRAAIDHLPIHLRAFKTPTLRNVALTAPYMHNGAFATLDQVLDFYDRGGGAGGGALVPGQTLSPEKLHLTVADRAALIAFLGTLTDTVIAAQGAPGHRPR